MVQLYIRKTAPFEAMQFDGTEKCAHEIINWVLSINPDTNIFFSPEIAPWESEDNRMKHNGVPATLHLGDDHVRETDWVVKRDMVLGYFSTYPNEEFVDNIIEYEGPAPEPTGHEEVSDPIFISPSEAREALHMDRETFDQIKGEEATDDVDKAWASYSGVNRDDSTPE